MGQKNLTKMLSEKDVIIFKEVYYFTRTNVLHKVT
jgi:hypothetical protein